MTVDSTMDGVAAIRHAITAARFRYADEVALHRCLEAAMRIAGLDPEPEVTLPGGRIDFLVGRVGVEVKVAGSVETVTRQLARYAPDVDALVLVTTRSAHRAVPVSVGGKVVTVVVIQGAAW